MHNPLLRPVALLGAVITPWTCFAVSPVEKVIQLLNDMHAQGVAEKNQQQVEAATFAQKCENSEEKLSSEIADLKEKIEEQTAAVNKAASAIAQLEAEVAELDEGTVMDTHDLAAAKSIRDSEKADYSTTFKDYSESLDALARAIQVLKSKSVSSAPVETLQVSLLQLGSRA